jgi:hypothetical protein
MADAAGSAPQGNSAPAGNGQESTSGQQDSTQQQQHNQTSQPKSWKSKVDGQEVTWQSEEELLHDAGLGKAAFKRMREAADSKKAVESFWKKLQEDPMSALEEPALNLSEEKRREIIEKYYQKRYIETDSLSPEQKELREVKAKLAEKEKAEKAEEDRKLEEKKSAAEKEWRDKYEQQIIDTIEKAGFPKTRYTAARVARYMAHAAEAGFDAPMTEIINQVGNELVTELQATLDDKVPMETLLKVLPPGFLKRLRQYDIEQYKARQAKLTQAPQQQEQRREPSERRKTDQRPTYAEVLRKFGS